MAKLSKAKLRQLDAMNPSDRAFALFTAVEKARSTAINKMRDERRRIDYDEAHQAALTVWNQWAQPLLKEREELEEAGTWAVKNEYSLEFSASIEVGQNPETQNFLRRADINARSITFIGADWQEENKGDGEDKSIATSNEPTAKTISCERINLASFSFPGNASFESAKFKGNADFENAKFKGDAGFESAKFKGHAGFSGATFKGDAYFSSAKFKGNANFSSALFKGHADFHSAQFKGHADFESATFNGNAVFSSAKFKGHADFESATFPGNASFHSAQFKGYAGFESATFKGYASFHSAQFKGHADFHSAQFKGHADFESATFPGNADFRRAQFKGYANFFSATFKGDADFSSATFKSNADFRQVDFLSHANFSHTVFSLGSDWTAINAVRAFNMAGARFETQVPQFTQAHFTESPRVDNIDLPMPERGEGNLPVPILDNSNSKGWINEIYLPILGFKGVGRENYLIPIQFKPELLADGEELGRAPRGETHQEIQQNGKRYRVRQRDIPPPKTKRLINQNHIAAFTALRRIAKQGEDHETEREAFKGEMRTQRIAGDHGLPYRLFSWAYDLFTDFGGSFLRPLLLWAALSIASAFIYADAATSPINKTEQATCSHPLTHASLLSARNALLFATAGQRPFVTKSLDCLYGKEPKEETIQHTTRTGPPLWLGLFGTAQTLLSAILIFFILLALRNRFKI